MALASLYGRRGPSFPGRMAVNLGFRMCELCDLPRATGGHLRSQPGCDRLWVCNDCQQKLARCLDDEGALGG